MLKMIKGCKIHSADMLREEYECQECNMMANVHADNIEKIVIDFIKIQKSKVFFILEVPTNSKEEEKLRADDTSPLHKDIFYLDGLDIKKAIMILRQYADILINDGLSCFGFGDYDHSAEIMVRKYNIITIWSNHIEKYNGFFESHGIQKNTHIKTAWETFSNKTPGESFRYSNNGKDIYDVIQDLEESGLYFAERREDS